MTSNLTPRNLACLVVLLIGLSVASTASAQNPIVIDTGRWFSGYSYNPWQDIHRYQTNRTLARASYYDPSRDIRFADPGSVQRVNQPIYNAAGYVVGYESGYAWSNNGVPHGNLNQSVVGQAGPNTLIQNNTRMLYDSAP